MRPNPQPNEIYRHFKGNYYQIVTMATDSETNEEMVVYKAMYGEGKVYVRALDMFLSEIDRAKYPEAEGTYRFEKTESMVDPGLCEFLDAASFEERLDVLRHIHPRITNDMIDTMALSLDLEIQDGDVENRYQELLNCIALHAKYEGNRLR